MRILIVGASAVSGQAAIAAARSLNEPVEVLATSSSSRDLKTADRTIHGIDLTQAQAVERIVEGVGKSKVDVVIYIPARGQVGMPARLSTAELVQESLEYSVIPYLKLHRALSPRRTISLSGFITMDPMLLIYGAMTFTKIAMEDLAVRHPRELQVIRLGMFLSNSVRGIALLVQRNMQRKVYPDLSALYEEWKQVGGRFQDFFWQKNYGFEERCYKQFGKGVGFRPTTEQDLEKGFARALRTEPEPIINVLGPWQWTQNTMPPLPAVIEENISLIPKDLDRHLSGS